MSDKQHLQPEGIIDATKFAYTQVVTASPGTLISIAGQIGWDIEGKMVSDDLAEQTEKALENLGLALAAAGATAADLTCLRVYIPQYKPKKSAIFAKALVEFLGDAKPPAQTLLGVEALALPDVLIEIEAQAVI